MTKMTDEQIAQGLMKTYGIIGQVPKFLKENYGIKVARQNVWDRVQRSKRLQEVQKQAREQIKDAAETVIITEIGNGNWKVALQVLKMLGKDRGYIERKEFSGPEGGAIPIEQHTVDLSKLSDEELKLFEEITRKLYGGKTADEPAGTG